MAKAVTHAKRRQALRKKLRAKGFDEALIDEIVARKARRQLESRRDDHDHVARERLIDSMRAGGATSVAIDRAVDRLVAQQEAARRAGVNLEELDRIHNETHTTSSPDDRRYKPDLGDPLLRGAARATGATAAAAKRRRTLTKYQHDRLNPKEPA